MAATRFAHVRGGCAAALAVLPLLAAAQPSPLPSIPDPSTFELELSEGRIVARRILVEGAKALTEAEVRAIVAPFEGRSLGGTELREIERRLTALYAERGLVTSGVLLARRPQGEGDVVFTAVEGTISRVRFRAPPAYADPRWLTGLLVPRPSEPVRIADLQERMAMLRESGVVDRINAELVPLPDRGAAELVLSVEEPRPWSVELRYDNHHSPVVGARRPSVWAEHRNVSGWGDRLEGHIGRTEGLDDLHVAYTLAFPRSPWRVGARYERSDSLAIDPPAFRDLEIATDSTTARVDVSNVLVATAAMTASATLAYERRKSDSTLLGIPFSFIAGLPDGLTEIDVARLSAEAKALGPGRVLFLRGQWTEGRSRRPILDLEGAPEERFRAFALQAQYAVRLGEGGAQAFARLDAQYSPDTLFPIEKKAVGGAETVRGYRENVLLRDSAVIATIEGRYPAWRSDQWQVLAAAFVDAAYARDQVRRPGDVSSIASLGVGVLAALPWGLSARVDYARPNRRWLTDDADSQDRGLHFRVSWTLPLR